jgi:hypothetical protein
MAASLGGVTMGSATGSVPIAATTGMAVTGVSVAAGAASDGDLPPNIAGTSSTTITTSITAPVRRSFKRSSTLVLARP